MKRILLTLTLIISICSATFGQRDCQQLPSTFSSYSEATSAIKSATFKINE